MNRADALAALDAYCEKAEADSIVGPLSEIVGATLANPAIPMLTRVAACLDLIAGSAVGLRRVVDLEGLDPNTMHRADLIPDIAAALRAAAAIYDEFAPQPPAGAPANQESEDGREDGNKLDG